MSTLKLGQIDEDEYFGRVLYDELVDILKNIRRNTARTRPLRMVQWSIT
jgi:hypothetical protein